VRRRTPELAGNALIVFDTHNPHLVAYQRPGHGTLVLVVANVADDPQHVDATTLSGLPSSAEDLLAGGVVDLRGGLRVPAHGVVWLRVGTGDAGARPV
jgi:amylosucrase